MTASVCSIRNILISLSRKARQRYPGLSAVDRLMRDRNENYLTPERGIPDSPPGCPWESCIPLSNDWGWVPGAEYKSARQVINILCEITAKGGCLLLGIGPTPEGLVEDAVVERLHEVGEWLKVNGETPSCQWAGNIPSGQA